MDEEVARCPHCGAIKGGTDAAIDALYREVSRIKELAERQRPAPKDITEALGAVKTREAELLGEIRLLRETVARLRGSGREQALDRP
jgi:predicted  nucleic acid-binding Zn-ribbon protein